MSAYAHQMEREYSVQSLLSGGASEMGSRYSMESGLSISSFAATIFIGGIVTIGVLLISLSISLAVMLRSCENSSKGIIEFHASRDAYNQNYDHIFSLYAELNNLRDLPSLCNGMGTPHFKQVQYERDLNVTMRMIKSYFDSMVPSDDSLDLVVFDVDDIIPSNTRLFEHQCFNCFKETNRLKKTILLRLYMKLQAKGWSLIFLSRNQEQEHNATVEHLVSAGYSRWLSIIMRSENELELDSREYFWKRRVAMHEEGLRIRGIISSQMDALLVPFLAERVFKLPNPLYYYLCVQKGSE